MDLLDRISARSRGQVEQRFNIDPWVSDYLLPTTFGFNGVQYGAGFGLTQTLAGNRATEIVGTLPGYLAALRSCPPAFAAELVRALVLSQARFVFRNPPWHPTTPRKTFGTRDLGILERPWKNATTGELIARMEWHAGLAGNAYVARRPDRLRVLRPDWTAILYGSHLEPDDPGHALDGELIGYVYQNQGLFNSQYRPQTLLPQDVAHWSPIPDPENAGVGMSWITPAIREIQKDRLATQHTIRYFENGATPNLVVKGIAAATREQFEEIVSMMEANHAGVANAYKTLYLAAGADATPVGANLADVDMKSVNGASETRIASLSRVHPVILGIAEGLAGSSLNAGNFGMARRIWADSWIYPTLQDLAASLAPIVNVPADAELWTDVGDMPILREDARDAAEIEQIKAATISSHVTNGFTRKSAIAAVAGQDVNLLQEDPNWISVQLQAAAGKTGQPGVQPSASGAALEGPPARGEGRKFDPAEPRVPGGEHGGEWAKVAGAVHKLGRMTEDEFFQSHGEDWHEQYGGGDAPNAILFTNGDAMLYRSTGRGKVDVLAKLDATTARQLGADVAWADGHPGERPHGVTDRADGLVESRDTALGGTVGYGYDTSDGFLFTRLTLPTAGGKTAKFDILDEDNAANFAADMDALADDIESGAYEGRSDGRLQGGRAAGVDTHPGGEQLKHYWLHGEGAAKWSTWTELYHHLVKYLAPEMAKRTAAEWFHERYGIWPGADLNRVKHGKPPRGHKVGPG